MQHSGSKVISFSLWGSDPLYTEGAIRNADIATLVYPGWTCYYYCNSCVPIDIIDRLKGKSNSKVIQLTEKGNTFAALNRFLAVEEDEVEYAIFRDADSRLSMREKIAVDAWLSAGADIHIMRDHPYHGWFVQAGMFGLKAEKFKGRMKNAIAEYVPTGKRTDDQDFISPYLGNRIQQKKLSVVLHDPFFAKTPFPKECQRGEKNGGVYFVGQRIEIQNGLDIYPTSSEDNTLVDNYEMKV
jgi:hypothetical protein